MTTERQPSDSAMAEPLAGITDAIQAAEVFVQRASAHRTWPDQQIYRLWTLADRDDLIAKLQALGPVGEEG